jgi:hypothetical protein
MCLLFCEGVGDNIKRGGKYGGKLYFYSYNEKWLMDPQVFYWCLVSFII